MPLEFYPIVDEKLIEETEQFIKEELNIHIQIKRK
jgi:hypothetical protein